MARQLKTVSQFAAESPWTEAQLRWFIFNAGANGMNEAGAVVRVGRRVFLDVEGVDRWIEAQQPQRKVCLLYTSPSPRD